MKQFLPKPIELAKEFISKFVGEGDVVVDATLGNGYDAIFLAGLVGDKGMVIGFDVQQQAVNKSTERFINQGIKNFKFHCKGHENMSDDVHTDISAVMFNLGYLPSSDKSVISKKETTILAIESAMLLLKINGVITVMCYVGHEGGQEEATAVLALVSQLKREQWRVFKYEFINAANAPPFLLVIEKISRD